MTQILKALATATTGLGLLLASAPLNAQQCSPDDISQIDSAQKIEELWRSRLYSFSDSATKADENFARAYSTYERSSVIAYINRHSSAALELGSFIGRERALQYSNEMLAISDALLAVKNFQQFHAVQARFRQTRVARMEIFAEMEQLLAKLAAEQPMPAQ